MLGTGWSSPASSRSHLRQAAWSPLLRALAAAAYPRPTARSRALNMAGFATLLFDLLTLPEEADQRSIFDVTRLTRRLLTATNWLQRQPAAAELALG
jgi:hypothetical protein